MTTPATRRGGRGRADRRRAGSRGFVAALVALVVSIASATAVPAQTEPATDPAPPAAEPGPPPDPAGAALELTGQTPFVAPTDVLRIGLRVTGAPADAELTFTIRQPVTAPGGARTAQARFDAWVDGTADDAEDPFNSPRTFPVANLPATGDAGEVEAAFPIVPDSAPEQLIGFRIADPGVYPLSISLHAPGGGIELDGLTTFVVRLPPSDETAPPLTVAPIAHLRAPVALQPDGTRSVDPTSLTRIRTLVDVLDEVDDVPVTVDPTPETLESLLGLGTVPADAAGPATTGTSLVEQLRRSLSGRAVLGSTYVTVDVDAWTRSSMQEVLGYQLAHGANVTGAVIDHVVPVDGTTWLATSGLTPEGLGSLRQGGVGQVVLDGSAVAAPDASLFPDPRRQQVAAVQPFDVQDADGDRVRAVADDERFGERLRGGDDEVLNAQTLVADLAVTYFGALAPQPLDVPETARGVAVEVPDDQVALRSLAPLLEALATVPPADGGGVPIFAARDLAGLLALPPATREDGTPLVRPMTPVPVPGAPEDMGGYPDELEAAEYRLSAYESLVLRTEPERVVPLRQLLDVSGAAGFGPERRRQYLAASTGAADAGLAGVTVPDQDPITITATEYEVPVYVENDLDDAVSVRLSLSSPKLKFPDGDTFDEVRLEPGRNRIPVRVSTVSAGTFPLEVSVTTPDSRVVLGEDTIDVRSTAVSGVGLALSIGAGFFLLVWWARNWRRTRRRPDAEPPDAPEPPTGEPSGTGAFTVGPLEDLGAATEPVGAVEGRDRGGTTPGVGGTDNLG